MRDFNGLEANNTHDNHECFDDLMWIKRLNTLRAEVLQNLCGDGSFVRKW